MASKGGYFPATRHPWTCFLFLLPLLGAYEGGVLYLGGEHPENLRNGADYWVRSGLAHAGVQFLWLPPLVLAIGLAVWAYARRGDRPGDLIGALSGMVIESAAFALGLWGIWRGLERVGVELAVSGPPPVLRQVIMYLGAGIYEEAIFRLVLFSAIAAGLKLVKAPSWVALSVAAVLSAALFSAAHHVGPFGQPFTPPLFLFRFLAGVYFAVLFQARGFGIAVGAHACYNVMVTVGTT